MVSDGPPHDGPPPVPSPPATTHPARRVLLWLGIVGLVLVIVAGTVATLVFMLRLRAHRAQPPQPGDLVMTLQARLPVGPSPSATPLADSMSRARDVLSARLVTAGYAHPRVTVVGTSQLSVRVGPTADQEMLKALAALGELSFRAVLGTSRGGQQAGTAPAGGPGTSSPGLAAVVAKLGGAYQVATTIPPGGQVDPQTQELLAPFGSLSPAEVQTLPPRMQYLVPTITCRQLDGRDPAATGDPARQLVACDRDSKVATKYALDAAKLVAEDIADVRPVKDPAAGWQIMISFTASGQERWTELTRQAYTAGDNRNRVAIVVDTQVVSAPTIMSVITGDAQLSGGSMTEPAVRLLAAELRSGPLPLEFSVTGITTAKK
jgi:preprotein translocase subunit SecD